MAEDDSGRNADRAENTPRPAVRDLSEEGEDHDERTEEAERVRDEAAAEARKEEAEREAERQNVEDGGAAEETANPDGHRDEPPFSS